MFNTGTIDSTSTLLSDCKFRKNWRSETHSLTLLTWTIWWAHNNASKWQMGFNSAFKRL